jgi:hypothetical protein
VAIESGIPPPVQSSDGARLSHNEASHWRMFGGSSVRYMVVERPAGARPSRCRGRPVCSAVSTRAQRLVLKGEAFRLAQAGLVSTFGVTRT